MGGSETVFARIRQFVGARDDELQPYGCLQCDNQYEVQYYVCPNCGSFTVERLV